MTYLKRTITLLFLSIGFFTQALETQKHIQLNSNECEIQEYSNLNNACCEEEEETSDEPKSLHQEIIEELEHVRATTPQLQWPIVCKSFQKYSQNRMDEAKILDSLNDNEFWQTYAAFRISAFLAQLTIDMVLLTRTTAPKTYAFVESVAQKMGISHIPYIYLASDSSLLNAAAVGFTPTTSIMLLGQAMVEKTANTQALEFVIAHELAHMKNYHIAKATALGLGMSAAFSMYNRSRFESTQDLSYVEAFKQAYNNLTFKNLAIDVTVNIGSALVAMWYRRLCEWDADMTAARAVGAQGGIELFTMLKQKEREREREAIIYVGDGNWMSYEDYYAANPPSGSKKIAIYAKNFFMKNILPFFMTHPSCDERIDYLTELQKQQEESTPKPAQA